jgi:dTDP-4-dehydrorhamnose 3,5-epimerase-like enzyme
MKLQKYGSEPSIEGVRLIDLKKYEDDGGSFTELGRFIAPKNHWETVELRGVESSTDRWQINHSKLEPNVVKGFHVHKQQTDCWILLDKAIVTLVDLRGFSDYQLESELYRGQLFKILDRKNRIQRLVLGHKPQILIIPSLVAHGLSSPYGPVNMLYFVNQFFNPEDEFRLPWDLVGEETWKIQNG